MDEKKVIKALKEALDSFYEGECGRVPYSLCFGENIDKKKVKNAVTAYGAGIKDRDVLALFDGSLMGNGKEGMIFSADAFVTDDLDLICEDPTFTRPVYFDMIRSVKASFREDSLLITLKNGKSYLLFFSIYTRFMECFLHKLLTS